MELAEVLEGEQLEDQTFMLGGELDGAGQGLLGGLVGGLTHSRRHGREEVVVWRETGEQ